MSHAEGLSVLFTFALYCGQEVFPLIIKSIYGNNDNGIKICAPNNFHECHKSFIQLLSIDRIFGQLE